MSLGTYDEKLGAKTFRSMSPRSSRNLTSIFDDPAFYYGAVIQVGGCSDDITIKRMTVILRVQAHLSPKAWSDVSTTSDTRE